MYKIKFHKLGSSFKHYGTKGQVHGVRNYQNYDGSLTPLGREHYGVGPARETRTSEETLNSSPDPSAGRKVPEGTDFSDPKTKLSKIRKGPNGELSEEDINTRVNEAGYMGKQLNSKVTECYTKGSGYRKELARRFKDMLEWDPTEDEIDDMIDLQDIPLKKGNVGDLNDFLRETDPVLTKNYDTAVKDIADAVIPNDMKHLGDYEKSYVGLSWAAGYVGTKRYKDKDSLMDAADDYFDALDNPHTYFTVYEHKGHGVKGMGWGFRSPRR